MNTSAATTLRIDSVVKVDGPATEIGLVCPTSHLPFPLECPTAHTLIMRLESIAVHAGHEPDAATGAVTPAIHLSTTFEREPDLSFRGGTIYSRNANPNRQSLEACLALLEGGAAGACFASGSAATT